MGAALEGGVLATVVEEAGFAREVVVALGLAVLFDAARVDVRFVVAVAPRAGKGNAFATRSAVAVAATRASQYRGVRVGHSRWVIWDSYLLSSALKTANDAIHNKFSLVYLTNPSRRNVYRRERLNGGMRLKRFFERLSTSMSDLDQQALREFCVAHTHAQGNVTPVAEVVARLESTVVGEISSLRIVPRAGSPWLEATITDGTGSITAMWTGRRRIAGVTPGKRLVISGRPAVVRGTRRLTLYNPRYELL